MFCRLWCDFQKKKYFPITLEASIDLVKTEFTNKFSKVNLVNNFFISVLVLVIVFPNFDFLFRFWFLPFQFDKKLNLSIIIIYI